MKAHMESEDAKKWDVFISYASEDKQDVARPLAHLLDSAGLRVWFDEFSLEVGDSLAEAIARGLAQARCGVAIISPAFMAKKWPRNELYALFSLEGPERGLILPVWHKVGSVEVTEFNPFLADRVALNTSAGLDHVARAIGSKVLLWYEERGAGPVDGLWTGESGRLLLRTTAESVFGDYDWYGAKWVGSVRGSLRSDALLAFDWSWTLDKRVGRGFFVETFRPATTLRVVTRADPIRCLAGAWWYSTDIVDELEAIAAWKAHLHGGSLPQFSLEGLPVHQWTFVADAGRL